MSLSKFIARFQILSITEFSPTEWDVVGSIYDFSTNSFDPSDVQVGDVFFDESPYDGNVNRWGITSILSIDTPEQGNIEVRCVYDEEGLPTGLFGEPIASDGAICKTTSDGLSYIPTTTWTQVSESVKVAISNLNIEIMQGVLDDTVAGVGSNSMIQKAGTIEQFNNESYKDFDIDFNGTSCEVVTGRIFINNYSFDSFYGNCELTFYSKPTRNVSDIVWRTPVNLVWTNISQDVSINDSEIYFNSISGLKENDLLLLSTGESNAEYIRIEKVGMPCVLEQNVKNEHISGSVVSLCGEFGGFTCIDVLEQKKIYVRISWSEQLDIEVGVSLELLTMDALVSSSSTSSSSNSSSSSTFSSSSSNSSSSAELSSSSSSSSSAFTYCSCFKSITNAMGGVNSDFPNYFVFNGYELTYTANGAGGGGSGIGPDNEGWVPVEVAGTWHNLPEIFFDGSNWQFYNGSSWYIFSSLVNGIDGCDGISFSNVIVSCRQEISSSSSQSSSSSSGNSIETGQIWYEPGSSWFIGVGPNEDKWYRNSYNGIDVSELSNAVYSSSSSSSSSTNSSSSSLSSSSNSSSYNYVETPYIETKLLLHGDDLIDMSASEHVVTAEGDASAGSAGNAGNPFGYGGIFDFDGNGDYLDVANSDDFDFGSGDFVLECFMNMNTVQNSTIMSSCVHTESSASIQHYRFGMSGSVEFYYTTDGYTQKGGQVVADGEPFSVDTWYHIALVRSGEMLRLYRDGVLKGSLSVGTDVLYNTTAPLRIGITRTSSGWYQPFDGSMSELRVLKGTDNGWTGSTIDVPTSKYVLETINYSLVEQLAISELNIDDDLIDFPLLLTEDNFPSDIFVEAQSDAGDISFYSDEQLTTRLACEIVKFDSVLSKAEIWVNIPFLSSNSNTMVYMACGTSMVLSQPDSDALYGSQAVWDSDFVAVYHMENNANDSTTFVNGGTLNNVTQVAQQIGNGYLFSGTGDINIASAFADLSEIKGTVAMWMKPNSTFDAGTSNNTLFSQWHRYHLYYENGELKGRTADDIVIYANDFIADQNYHICFNWSYEGTKPSNLAIDGLVVANRNMTGTNSLFYSNPLALGKSTDNNSNRLNASLDEVRISRIKRSDAWNKVEYHNQKNPALMVTYVAPSSSSSNLSSSSSSSSNSSSSSSNSSSSNSSSSNSSSSSSAVDGCCYITLQNQLSGMTYPFSVCYEFNGIMLWHTLTGAGVSNGFNSEGWIPSGGWSVGQSEIYHDGGGWNLYNGSTGSSNWSTGTVNAFNGCDGIYFGSDTVLPCSEPCYSSSSNSSVSSSSNSSSSNSSNSSSSSSSAIGYWESLDGNPIPSIAYDNSNDLFVIGGAGHELVNGNYYRTGDLNGAGYYSKLLPSSSSSSSSSNSSSSSSSSSSSMAGPLCTQITITDINGFNGPFANCYNDHLGTTVINYTPNGAGGSGPNTIYEGWVRSEDEGLWHTSPEIFIMGNNSIDWYYHDGMGSYPNFTSFVNGTDGCDGIVFGSYTLYPYDCL